MPSRWTVGSGAAVVGTWIWMVCPGVLSGGALTLIIGEFLETLVCHIPKNDALAAHKGGNDADVWARYYTSWTAWNHVRMVASLATVVQFSLALFYRGARLGAGYGGLP